MRKKIFATIFILFSFNSWAKPLYMEITGSKNIGVPFYIDFKSFNNTEIGQTINRDLSGSGQFSSVDKSKAEKIIIGKVEELAKNRFNINFKVLDAYYSIEAAPILEKKYKNIKKEDFRKLAHVISDDIFEKITGVKGFFSTKISYITINKDNINNKTYHSLVIADCDGYNDKVIVKSSSPLMSPSWSPDGKKLAYVSFEGHKSSVNVIDVETGKVNLLSNFEGINGAPAWSNDGCFLALVLSKDEAVKLYTLDLRTKDLKKITSGFSIDTEPFWEVGDNSIVFTSNRGGKPQIYRVILESGRVERLSFNGDYNATPSITKDSKKLIMLHKSEDGSFNIAVEDLATGRFRKLTNGKYDESPTLAPNGMMVLYGTRETDRYILSAVSLDGRFKMRLPLEGGHVKEPTWSPFLQ